MCRTCELQVFQFCANLENFQWKSVVKKSVCKGLLITIFSEKLNILLVKMSSYSFILQVLYSFNPMSITVSHSDLQFLNRSLSSLGREALGTFSYCPLSLCSFVFLWRALGCISVSPNAIKHLHVLYFTAITVGSCFIQPSSDHKSSFYVGIRDHR